MSGQQRKYRYLGPRLSQWESRYSRGPLRVRSFAIGIRLVCYDRRCLYAKDNSLLDLAWPAVFFLDVRHVRICNLGNLFPRSSVVQFSQFYRYSRQSSYINGLLIPSMCCCPFLSLDGTDVGCLRSRSSFGFWTKHLNLFMHEYLQDICLSSRTDATFNPNQNWTKQFHVFNFSSSVLSLFIRVFARNDKDQISTRSCITLIHSRFSLCRSSRQLVCHSCIHFL